jgi:ubiquinone/menaquinone biosynthesis C-methylase UbiE
MAETQAVNTTYEPFSLEPEYVETNQRFVRRPDLGEVERFLDLACGNGVVSQLLLEAKPEAHLNGLDYDPIQIDLIEKRFTDLGYEVRRGTELTDDVARGKPVLVFGVGSADELPYPEASFDCVTIANAIHMLPDRQKLLRAVHRVLKPGGMFGFNTSFYAGTFPEGTHQFYLEWLKRASQRIVERSRKRVEDGGEPIKRVRGTTHRAFQVRWLTPSEWSEELAQAGFREEDVHQREVLLSGRSFAAVGAYAGMAEVLLSGYPVEEASFALQSTAEEAVEAMNLPAVPRNWLEMWATA